MSTNGKFAMMIVSVCKILKYIFKKVIVSDGKWMEQRANAKKMVFSLLLSSFFNIFVELNFIIKIFTLSVYLNIEKTVFKVI